MLPDENYANYLKFYSHRRFFVWYDKCFIDEQINLSKWNVRNPEKLLSLFPDLFMGQYLTFLILSLHFGWCVLKASSSSPKFWEKASSLFDKLSSSLFWIPTLHSYVIRFYSNLLALLVEFRIQWLCTQQRGKTTQKICVLGMTLNSVLDLVSDLSLLGVWISNLNLCFLGLKLKKKNRWKVNFLQNPQIMLVELKIRLIYPLAKG